jgi:hypothetical protein
MAITITDTVRTAAADGIRPVFAGGVINVYAGAVPANAGAALGGATLLAEVTAQSPAFSAAAAGVLTLSGVPLSDNSINVSGTASFFRLVQGANVMQGTVGTTSTDMIVDSVNFVQGGIFTITNMTVTMPAG